MPLTCVQAILYNQEDRWLKIWDTALGRGVFNTIPSATSLSLQRHVSSSILHSFWVQSHFLSAQELEILLKTVSVLMTCLTMVSCPLWNHQHFYPEFCKHRGMNFNQSIINQFYTEMGMSHGIVHSVEECHFALMATFQSCSCNDVCIYNA